MAEQERPIALVACEAGAPCGPIELALAHEGFETREVCTPEAVDAVLQGLESRGARRCLLVIGAEMLPLRRGCARWSTCLRPRPGLALVVVSLGRVDDATRAAVHAAGGILEEAPFDAAAVVAAARRACRAAPVRSLPRVGAAGSSAAAIA
jgi:hypothetical protein